MSNIRLQKLLEMIEEQPFDLFLQYALAMEYLGMEQVAEAESRFRAIIEADQHYVAAYYQLGKLVEATNESEAIVVYEKGMAEASLKGDQKTVNEFRSAIEELTF